MNGVLERGGTRGNLNLTPADEDKIERTVVIMGLKYLLGPAFAGDDHNDALFPSDVAKWFGEQVGPS